MGELRSLGWRCRSVCGALVTHLFPQEAYPAAHPFMNLGLSLLEEVDVEVERIADSTGRLAGV